MSSKNKTDYNISVNQEGCVIIKGADSLETIRPWGHPDGFGISGCKRAEYNGQAEQRQLVATLRWYGCSLAFNHPRMQRAQSPIDRLVQCIPRDVLTAIHHIPHWPIELIQVAEINPNAFVLLAQSNPALVALLGSLGANHTLWGPAYFGQYLGRDENDICRQLGYGSSLAGYLRKFADVGLTAHGYMNIAISAWRRQGMRRLLCHVQSVTLDVMTTAATHWRIVTVCPSLLHIAAGKEDLENDYSTEVCEHVEAISQLRSAMQKPAWPWRRLNDIDQLRHFRQRTEEQAIKTGVLARTTYPPPPISPCSNWRWIGNSEELEDFGHRYKNCATTYHWRCITGCNAIYVSRRTDYDDTVIVVLSQEPATQTWQVSDILGPSNKAVPQVEANSIRLHFESLLKGGKQ